jgi:alpha-galactosidase
VAQEQWLPQYKKAIAEARKRLASGKLLPTKDYNGIRVHTRTVEEMRATKGS